MDKRRIGQTIAYMRKQMGYTQKDLADRIGISDKAVSKWERGLGLPDIAYLGKLSILLDTDAESLLSGEGVHHGKEWCGILVLPLKCGAVSAGTMIYDKPLVYFLLSYFILVGIKNIYIVCNHRDEKFMEEELGDGSCYGIRLQYCGQYKAKLMEKLMGEDGSTNAMLVYGRNLIYGVDQTRFFQRAMLDKQRVTVLALPGKVGTGMLDSDRTLYFDTSRRLVDSDSKEKIRTQYDYCKLPVLFCPKGYTEQICEESFEEGVVINLKNLGEENIYTEVLDRGYIDMQINTEQDVLDASLFTRLVQQACGMEIYCFEEILWRRGMITLKKLSELGEKKSHSPYGSYILSLVKQYENR